VCEVLAERIVEWQLEHERRCRDSAVLVGRIEHKQADLGLVLVHVLCCGIPIIIKNCSNVYKAFKRVCEPERNGATYTVSCC